MDIFRTKYTLLKSLVFLGLPCIVTFTAVKRTGAMVPLKHSNIAGSVFGLSIQYYIGFHSNLTQFMSAYGKGGYVRIGNSSFLEDGNLDSGVNVSPGTP